MGLVYVTHIYHLKNQPNVGRYTIHGTGMDTWPGYGWIAWFFAHVLQLSTSPTETVVHASEQNV